MDTPEAKARMRERGLGEPFEKSVDPVRRGVHVHDKVVEPAQLDGLRKGPAQASVHPHFAANSRRGDSGRRR